jgi:hypothetical protein
MTDLLKEYRELAALGGNFRGFSLLQHAKDIGKVVKRHQASTLLDYGSGAGDAYKQPHKVHEAWGINRMRITLYDPSFPKLAPPVQPSARFSGVICSDVLEHVPEVDIDAFIDTLFSHAIDFVWASVCCRPAKKLFADGTNMHVTIHPIEWWQAKFADRCEGQTFYLVETP